MKLILMSIAVFMLISIIVPVFADTQTVKMVRGSGVPGCETSGGCYSPDPVVIHPGDSVRWLNVDSVSHTATSGTPADGPDGVFDSGLIMASGDWYNKFSDKGIYSYFCTVHPWMTSQVWVVELEEDEPESESTQSSPTTSSQPSTPSSSSTTSSINWQQRYLEVLSDFNDVSEKVGELEKKNSELSVQSAQYRIENEELKKQIDELNTTIENLNAIIQEQVNVIYEWILEK